MSTELMHASILAAVAGAALASPVPQDEARRLIAEELDRRQSQTESAESGSESAEVGSGSTVLHAGAQSGAGDSTAAADDWQVLRVAGQAEAEIETREMTKAGEPAVFYSAGLVSTQEVLAVGYPRPTPPGAIELKKYPSLRRAEYTAGGSGGRASNDAFMRLFRHIQTSDIAMTSPVEVDVPSLARDAGEDDAQAGMTMSFLYRVPELGPTGEAKGGVRVVDTEPMVALCLGVRGEIDDRDEESMARKLDLLYTWLDEQASAAEAGELIWVESGVPRWLGYNAPFIPRDRRWWEVQIPVQQVVKR